MPLDFELWLDTHLSSAIAKWLKEDKGWEVKPSYILKLHGLEDIDIYKKAKAAGYVIIITKIQILQKLYGAWVLHQRLSTLKLATLITACYIT